MLVLFPALILELASKCPVFSRSHLEKCLSVVQPALWPCVAAKWLKTLGSYVKSQWERNNMMLKTSCAVKVSCIYLCDSCFTRIWCSLKCLAACPDKLSSKYEDLLNIELMSTLRSLSLICLHSLLLLMFIWIICLTSVSLPPTDKEWLD